MSETRTATGHPDRGAAPLRWGILGTGMIARDFVAEVIASGIVVTAVGSQDQGRADAFAAEFRVPQAFGSQAALAACADVDVVYVATPSPDHARNAIACLRAGKHVLVEKPFTLSGTEAAAVARTAGEAGLLAQEAMWPRFLPHMGRIRRLIADGALGTVRTVIADFSQRMPDAVRRRMLDPGRGGGALLDLGSYPLSFAWDVLGAPESIRATSSFAESGLDSQTSVLLGYADGAQAVLHAQLDATGVNGAVVIGTEGRIEIDPVWFTATDFRLVRPDGEVVERFASDTAARGLHFQAHAVEAAIRAGMTTTTELPLEESVEVMRAVDRIRQVTRA